VDIGDWIQRHRTDPWYGIQATVQRNVHRNPQHVAFLHVQQGQTIALLSQPFWRWHDATMLSGTYVVAVSTYNQTTPTLSTTTLDTSDQPTAPTTLGHTTNEGPRTNILGVAPLCALLAATVR
jgi:hypothetical protein